MGRAGGCTPLTIRLWAELPLPQEPQDQGLSVQTPPAEELPGRNLNQGTSPTRIWRLLEEESASLSLSPSLHNPQMSFPSPSQPCLSGKYPVICR